VSVAPGNKLEKTYKCNCGYSADFWETVYKHVGKMIGRKKKCRLCDKKYCFLSMKSITAHSLKQNKQEFDSEDWETVYSKPEAGKNIS